MAMKEPGERHGRPALWLLPILLATLLSGCGSDTQQNPTAQTAGDPVVARIDESAITLAEVDQKIRLERHDLALDEYQLRFNTLKSMVDAELTTAATTDKQPAVDWLLPHPTPPRLEIDTAGRPLRGNPEAPVTLAVFCSYQSVHCASTNLVLRELLERYAGWIAVAPFDFPMHYHRQGIQAATAVHCASQQGTPWGYADGLYTRAKTMEADVFPQLASQLGFAQDAFDRCLGEPDGNDRIAADTALARTLGLQSVPVVFINGLYVKGPKTSEHYAMWIDEELARLGHDPASPHAEAARWRQSSDGIAETDLPLQLSGTSVSSQPEQSTALIRIRDASASRFSPGDTLMPGATLKQVHERHVILQVDDRLERLSLRGDDGDTVHVPRTDTTPRDEATMRRIEQPEGESRKLIPPSGVLPLGQEWLEKQLANRAELEKKFVNAEHVVDGHNLQRLEGIENSEFFTALGFEEGDVVVRVNDSWVHSGQNQLWDALTSGQVVDVTFMRNGLPQRVQYVVQEKGYFEENNGQKNSGSDDKTD
ncbi:thioredoxin domain-containing protein [Microbulbifer hydrolyticus]|uniref:Protein-disulfide isomerase/type II secretory pathway component PulC n=1 Tax=Microbulbifer hydrolyticus TaxID=48074 RepID=A0A6P1TB84_9GAMM|nr:thioredoxin domain-containing protein [Microbulbifer hydrolyticus]MBB5212392.1 protein-disulfide isomerase/type II secretory pathway component PulC [Microbulbifer hydrolyticus]QHQ40028.1 thioredoxin domain-containing protein [Microbulbifer hydrolyticus]